jgi:hypothetical protein
MVSHGLAGGCVADIGLGEQREGPAVHRNVLGGRANRPRGVRADLKQTYQRVSHSHKPFLTNTFSITPTPT